MQISRNLMKRLSPAGLVIFIFILAIAFPFQWAVAISPQVSHWFNQLFNATWLHIFMHFFLFTTLAFLLNWFLEQRRWPRPISRVLTMVLGVAFFQEALQMLPAGIGLGPDEIFDFFIDLCGGICGYALFSLVQKLRKRKQLFIIGKVKS